VEVAGHEAYGEHVRGLAGDASEPEVVPGVFRRLSLVLHEDGVAPGGEAVVQVGERVLPLLLEDLLGVRCFELDSGLFGERLHRLGEAGVLHGHVEREDVAAPAASEAVEGAVVVMEDHAGVLFPVDGAAAPRFPAAALDRGVARCEVADADPAPDEGECLLAVSHGFSSFAGKVAGNVRSPQETVAEHPSPRRSISAASMTACRRLLMPERRMWCLPVSVMVIV